MKKFYMSVIIGCLTYASSFAIAAMTSHSMPIEQANYSQASAVAGTQELVTADSTAHSEDITMPPSITSGQQPAWLQRKLRIKPTSRFHFNGFISAGGSQSSVSNEARYRIPGHGTVGNAWVFGPNSLLGLQLLTNLTDNVAIVGQFVTNGDNSNGEASYRVNAEWAFLRVNLGRQIQFRVGRFRMPLFLYSDTQQVGYSYPWLFLPNEVYRIVPFQNLNGISLIENHPFGSSGWNLLIQPFYGSSRSGYDLYANANTDYIDNPGTSSVGDNYHPEFKGSFLGTIQFDEDNVLGISLQINNPVFSFHAAYTHLTLSGSNGPTTLYHLDHHDAYLFPADKFSGSANFYTVGMKLDMDNFLASGEYAHRDIDAPLPIGTGYPLQKLQGGDRFANLTGYYGMLGYRIKKWLPTFTYGNITTTNHPKFENVQKQHSFTLGLNYFLNGNVMMKASVSDVIPQDGSGLFTLMPNISQVFVYGAELDAIFLKIIENGYFCLQC